MQEDAKKYPARLRYNFQRPYSCGVVRRQRGNFAFSENIIKLKNPLDKLELERGGFVRGYRIRYTHEYMDTYTCLQCGTVEKVETQSGGGTYEEYQDGQVFDHRTKPREF